MMTNIPDAAFDGEIEATNSPAAGYLRVSGSVSREQLFADLEDHIADAFAQFFAELGADDENLSDQCWVWEDANSVYIAEDGSYGSASGLRVVPSTDPWVATLQRRTEDHEDLDSSERISRIIDC